METWFGVQKGPWCTLCKVVFPADSTPSCANAASQTRWTTLSAPARLIQNHAARKCRISLWHHATIRPARWGLDSSPKLLLACAPLLVRLSTSFDYPVQDWTKHLQFASYRCVSASRAVPPAAGRRNVIVPDATLFDPGTAWLWGYIIRKADPMRMSQSACRVEKQWRDLHKSCIAICHVFVDCSSPILKVRQTKPTISLAINSWPSIFLQRPRDSIPMLASLLLRGRITASRPWSN